MRASDSRHARSLRKLTALGGYGGAVHRNSYALAALAAAAVPGLIPVKTAALPSRVEGLEIAGVIGEDARRVVVISPSTPAAGAAMEQDLHVAESLLGTSLRTVIPPVLGFATAEDGGRVAVTEAPVGHPLAMDEVAANPELAHALGSVIARIHAVPRYAAEATGVETYTAQALREEHQGRMKRALEAGLLPAAVAQRWEHLLADDDLWDFSPQFVHGDLSEDCVFNHGGRISAVLDWHSARVGDPAQDLAWLIPALDTDSFDAVHSGYRQELPTVPHRRLIERAQLLGEFAVLQWLLHGVDTEDQEIIDDARGMLTDLDDDLAQIAREEAERAYEEMQEHHEHEAHAQHHDSVHDGYAHGSPAHDTEHRYGNAAPLTDELAEESSPEHSRPQHDDRR